MLGLTVQEHTRQVAILGVGGVTMLELTHPDALPDDRRQCADLLRAVIVISRASNYLRIKVRCRLMAQPGP